jgi:hypothetical protein
MSNSKSSRRDFNDFREFSIVKLIHIVAHPITITEDICKLFAVVWQQILTQVSIKARGAVFATTGVVQRAS